MLKSSPGVLALAALIFLQACSGPTAVTPPADKPAGTAVAVTGVTLPSAAASVAAGASLVLKATVAPSNAANPAVTWKSSDDTVAKVAADGTVTGIKAGSATITVTTADGAKTASCAVTVTASTGTAVAVTGVTLPSAAASVAAGASLALKATVEPSNAANPAVTWKSSDDTVAKVAADGTVTGIKAGSATITVTTADGAKTASCAVTVTASTGTAVAVTGVTVTPTTATVAAGASLALKATVEPSNAANPAVTWKSSDDTVAKVAADGTVSGVKAGSATITVTTADGAKTATCTVTVTSAAKALEPASAEVPYVKDISSFSFVFSAGCFAGKPAGTTYTWTKSDDQEFGLSSTVTSTGVPFAYVSRTALSTGKPGPFTITCKASDGDTATATFTWKKDGPLAVSTLAGQWYDTTKALNGGTGLLSRPQSPVRIGRAVYFIDNTLQDKTILAKGTLHGIRILKLDLDSKAVTLVAGSDSYANSSLGDVDGKGTSASFWELNALATDGVYLYASSQAGQIRKINPADGTVTTLCGKTGTTTEVDGPAASAVLAYPGPMACANGSLYVASTNNGNIRKIDTTTGAVTLYSGTLNSRSSSALTEDGAAAAARWGFIRSLAWDGANRIYVYDETKMAIRYLDLSQGTVGTLHYGDTKLRSTTGISGPSAFSSPARCRTLGYENNKLYFQDWNNALKVMDLSSQQITVLATNLAAAAGPTASTIWTEPQSFNLSHINFTMGFLVDSGTVIVCNDNLIRILTPNGL